MISWIHRIGPKIRNGMSRTLKRQRIARTRMHRAEQLEDRCMLSAYAISRQYDNPSPQVNGACPFPS
jgi:hypothetical protein